MSLSDYTTLARPEIVDLLAGATGQRIKAAATDDRIERAFRWRGFAYQTYTDKSECSRSGRPLELPPVSTN